MNKLIDFLKFHYRLLKQSLLDQLFHEELDIPTARLRKRVHGSFCPKTYHDVGEMVFKDLVNLSEIESNTYKDVLDFGCGPGRVAGKFLREGIFVHGTDIDEKAISYCRRQFPRGKWEVNKWSPPLIYKSNFFDFIYSISVFTHINEDLQKKWLKEISRILKPDGLAIISVHGENCYRKLDAKEVSLISEKGFYYKIENIGIFKTDGLPNDYQTSYQTKEYVKSEWRKYFEYIEVHESGIGNHQDAIILRKPLF
jgi:SAM-dependent methyltransferase